jgi:hypothetical protein
MSQMEFEPIDFSKLKEQGVREVILAPMLTALGYRHGGPNNIDYEVPIPYPRIQMGKRKPTDPPLEGRADYVCTVESKYRWTLEAKAPDVPIATKEIEQAYSYAYHPAIRAIYFCLCNGREFRVYQTHLGPAAEAIYSTKYESLTEDLQIIKNILLPESIVRDWKAQSVDVGVPIGQGLRSLVKITGGYIEYQRNSLNVPHLGGLINTITDGSIYRDDDKQITAYIVTMSLHVAFQRFNEALDLHRMLLRSPDFTLSRDPSRPSILHSCREVVLPRGSEAVDLGTWTPFVLPEDIRIRIETTGKGVLLGQEFSGEFDASFFFRGLPPR